MHDIHRALRAIASYPPIVERKSFWVRKVQVDIPSEDHFHRARASVFATIGGDSNRTELIRGKR
jgi:hypothetical protein